MRPKRPFTTLAVLICVVFVVHAQQQQPYLLGPGDVLEVRVFGQHDLSSNSQVDSDGNQVDCEAVKKNKDPDVFL